MIKNGQNIAEKALIHGA